MLSCKLLRKQERRNAPPRMSNAKLVSEIVIVMLLNCRLLQLTPPSVFITKNKILKDLTSAAKL